MSFPRGLGLICSSLPLPLLLPHLPGIFALPPRSSANPPVDSLEDLPAKLLGSSQFEGYDEPNPIGVAPPTPGFTSFRDLTWASPSVFKLEGNKKHTKRRLMEEIGQKPPGMVLEPCKKMGFQLPTSSGVSRIYSINSISFLTYGCFQK